MVKLNYVSNIEKKSLKFYKEIFGFKLVNQFGSGEAKIATIDIGGGLLELVQRPDSPGTPPMVNGNRLCFFNDPDGHTVEIMESGFQ